MSKIKILHVEDYEPHRLAINEILYRAGYEVVEAATGHEALQLVMTERPQLVLLDLTLPDINGFEICRRIKADPATSSILVLEISGEFLEAEDRARGLEGGADGYLTKPVGIAELLANIKALLRLHHAEEQARQARADAEVSEAHYRLMFEGNPMPTWVFDLESLKFLAVNEAAMSHYGYSRDEFLSMTVKEISPFIDVPILLDQLAGLRRATPAGWRHKRKDGSMIDVEIVCHEFTYDGRRAMLVLARDVTERKRSEEALRASESRFRSFFECSMVPIGVWNKDGGLTMANDTLLDLVGYTREELESGAVRWFRLTPPEYWHRDERAMAEIRAKGVCTPFEKEYIHKDGHRVPIMIGGAALGDESSAGVFFAIDLSERKKAEAEREELLRDEQELRQEAEEASRLKDEFLTTLSHELRMPLHLILGNLHLLRTQTMSEEELARTLETIERNARAQKQIISDLLDVAEIITGRFRLNVRLFNMISAIESALEAVTPAAVAKDISLNAELDAGAGLMSGDPDRLQQVAWNLFSNAVKFTPPGGSVRVRLERKETCIELTVSDTGEGISAEFLPFVFDRFRQADASSTRRHGGIGLGLSIVRHLVELHGGGVEADSAGQGKGSTFTVRLPLWSERKEQREVSRVSTTVCDDHLLEDFARLDGAYVRLEQRRI